MSAYQAQRFNFRCPKCANTTAETGELRAAGGFLSKVFDVQHRKFTTVTCSRCRYTEMYKADSSMLGNIFDLFTN
jgi:predicted nucleic-acid-binding Zn-ribbon protein